LRLALEKFWAPVPWMLEAAAKLGEQFCTDAVDQRAQPILDHVANSRRAAAIGNADT
jgi:hypothetical protein